MRLFFISLFLMFSFINTFAKSIDIQIIDGADDAEEQVVSGEVNLNSSDLEFVKDKTKQIIGLRFQNINIPRDSTITRAYLKFTVAEKSFEPTNLKIYGEVTPNALSFSYQTKNISTRVKTKSFSKWSVPRWSIVGEHSKGEQSSDIAPVIQEIISQKEWKMGNSMVFIISGDGKRVAKSYNGSVKKAPILHIEYQNNITTTELDEGYVVQSHILSSSDTAEEFNGEVNTLSSDLEMVEDKNRSQVVGLRFVNIDIPKHAVIQRAYIQFTTDEVSSKPTELIISGQKVANATTFLSLKNNISDRKRTDSSIYWYPKAWNIYNETGDNQKTPNLSTIVQEIVDQEEWSAGNSIAFIISGSGKRVAKSSYHLHSELAPTLFIEYSDDNLSQINPEENSTNPEENATNNLDAILDINISNESRLTPIKELLNRALQGEQNISYIVVGDSKRHIVADYPYLYKSILDQLNVNFHKNAIGGMTAKRWLTSTNIRVGFNKAIQDATGEQGDLTIIEYSLGGNDYNQAKIKGSDDIYATIAPDIKKSIIEIKKRLPKVKIVLVSPIGSYRKELKQLYRDISKEFNLPLIENPMDRYRDNPDTKFEYFFEGSVHPNEKGAKRLVYSILYDITDKEARAIVAKEINKDISIFY